jgi:hypothetical protein
LWTTGIANCYGAVRQMTLTFVEENAPSVAAVFHEVASSRGSIKEKIQSVMKLVDQGPKTANSKKPLLNGLTPTLACLDPTQRFPIMNGGTAPLQKRLRESPGETGALRLVDLIETLGIENSFDLDVYSVTQF